MKTEPLTLVFMGSDPIALPLLNELVANQSARVRVATVFTQPDRAVGRGQKVVANAIKSWALNRGIPVRQPPKLDQAARETLAAARPDFVLVMAYGHILREAFITTPRLGTLNLHTSILPRYRGASPIQSAVANGDAETGVTLMRIVRELDAGPVADLERVPILPGDTALAVEHKLAMASVPLVTRNLDALAEDALTFTEQAHGEATFCRKLTKADGVLDFTASAKTLAQRINGLHPWPGCRVPLPEQSVRLGAARWVPADATPGAQPGTVLPHRNGALAVATGEGTLELTQLQRPGGRLLPAPDFLRGFPVPPGTLLPSVPMPTLISPASP